MMPEWQKPAIYQDESKDKSQMNLTSKGHVEVQYYESAKDVLQQNGESQKKTREEGVVLD